MTQWRKSNCSNTSGGACVEVASLAGSIGVRDSKSPDAGTLRVEAERFAVFLARIKRNELDR